MSAGAALAVLLAGLAAGVINAVVGAGTLFTFSTLVAVGIPPLTANVSNTIGLVPGTVSGAWGYREELAGQRPRVRRLASASATGGLTGALLLLVLPPSVFRAVVPALILLAVALVLVQPRIARRLALPHQVPRGRTVAIWGGVYLAGVYGGYFGAAQGVMLIALLGALLDPDLQRVNALKNVLAGVVNGVAAVVFALVAPVDWRVVALLVLGALPGGYLGSRFGRRLPQPVLRAVVVVVGLAAAVVLVAR